MKSTCAAAALRAEIERTRAMTIEERIKAALSLSRRLSWIRPAPLPAR